MTAPAPSTPVTRRHTDELTAGFVPISDRASADTYQDGDIPALRSWLGAVLSSSWQGMERLIPDDQTTIAKTLIDLVDHAGCDLILTTSGTDPMRRDVTPEATLTTTTKKMPGFGEQMRQISLHPVSMAILSRQVTVIHETPLHAALIINLPGQPHAIKETLESLRDVEGRATVPGTFAIVPYCIDLIGDPYIETRNGVVEA